jgi:ATP adenylyltransferase
MRYIAAPWRADYVRQGPSPKRCVFCDAARSGDDRAAAVVWRGRQSIILLNRYPYTPGHLLISPKRHRADFAAAGPAERNELGELLQMSLRMLARAYRPQGFNAGMNLGASAGAGITEHYHLHIVPRWPGDSNFMPLVGGTRVFIEDLDMTYQKLRPLFDQERRRRERAGRAKRRATASPR